MATTSFSLERALDGLEQDGFVDLKDESIGEHVLQMEQRRFPFSSKYGLDFCDSYVLQDKRIRSIIESVFPRCILAHWLRYEAYPGHIVSFMQGGQKAGRCAVMVHLLSKGSRVNYFLGSHLLELPATKGRRLLWETALSALTDAGHVASEKTFEQGGMVIIDARTRYEIKEGYAIKFEFVTEDLVTTKWPKMMLPSMDSLRRKVDEMQSAKIALNFAFYDHLVAEPK